MNSLIFPNGCLPSVEVIARSVARHSDLRMIDLDDITPHYAETLRRWRANFDTGSERYDERFVRLWRLYLELLRGGFHRTKDRQRADRAGQAALAARPGRRDAARGRGMRRAAVGILGFRIVYGAGLLLAPDKITKSWLGPLDDPARVALQALGTRARSCSTRWRSRRCSTTRRPGRCSPRASPGT